MLIVVVLLATVLLRFTLVAAAVYLLLPRGSACPRCAAALALVHSPLLERILPLVEHRWCLECGWSGVVRRAKPPHSPSLGVINRAPRS